MVGANKILTVSYGTFSCTLEGFEDSFGTMKAIAEYFRDLAADDRYFGAEPPTPDAEMLQRIAEREILKHVESRVDGNGILLRPASAESEPSPVLAPNTPERDPTRANAGRPPMGNEAESVAAKLARIRAVVEKARTAAPADIVSDAFPATETRPFAAAPTAKTGTEGADAADARAEPHDRDALPERMAAGPLQHGRDDATDTDTRIPGPARYVLRGFETADSGAHPADIPSPEPESREATLAPSAPHRPRVLTLDRTDLVDAPPPDQPPPPEDAQLPADLEAELLAELAAIDAEARAEHAWDGPTGPAPESLPERAETAALPETVPEITAPPAAQRRAGHLSAPNPEREEFAIQRLLDKTNSELAGVEQQRRRDSIAHLKAAVAATTAERRENPDAFRAAEEERQKRPYRQTLAKVVRGEAGARGEEARKKLPPLMLVSEQRIDRPRLDPARLPYAVRPRPPDDAHAVLNDEDEADPLAGNIFDLSPHFAVFVEGRGASGIREVLEAAAAYVLSVKAQAHFRRPQVVRLAQSQLGRAIPREAVLREFGALLREGIFKKVRRGEFVMPDPMQSAPVEPARRKA